jgi:glucose/arabinose dehydrogenase/cytochrome c2
MPTGFMKHYYYKNRFVNFFIRYAGIFLVTCLIPLCIFLTSYTPGRVSGLKGSDTLALNPFVEPGFPFISSAIDARRIGAAFPGDNIAARTLALQLGDSAYACFDTDLLRWSVGWTGKFLPMVSMAQISYQDFFNKNNKVTTLSGVPKIATGAYAGWSASKPGFAENSKDPKKEDEISWAPLPADKGRWNGVYVDGKQVILQYSVGKSEISELPGSAVFEGGTVFTRGFQIGAAASDLFLVAAEVIGAASNIQKGQFAYIFQGAGKDTVTAIGILGKGGRSLKPGVADNRYLTLQSPASAGQTEFAVAIWKGPADKIPAFEKFCRKYKITFPAFKKGGSAHWPGEVVTRGKLSPDTAAYVTDLLTLPLSNPWKRNVRVADIAFFKDGRAAAVTFEGDVWMISGIDKNLSAIRWKRYASGLHEPMSVEVVQDTVYIFGREGIVRLHDLNGDGEADYYENFSNVMLQSAESREWAGDMVYGPDKSFYIAKGGAQSNGPGVTPQVAKGFRAGSKQDGTILKISPDGRQAEVFATGLRGPYLGIHPQNGTLTASDQQGNFVPSTPIYLIRKGDYYGVPPTRHRDDNPEIAPPLTWIPHSEDRSSISQAWITGNKMGPLSGNLIHFSFAHPGLFRVLIDSTADVIQGGVSFIQANYPAPTSKGTVNPVDQQLYITGFNLWGSSSTGLSALLRLRYTGQPSYMPAGFSAAKDGIMLRFDSPLDSAAATDPSRYTLRQWNYQRTEAYGSGHFKTDGTSGEETLPVLAAYLSSDKKKVFLLVRDVQPIMQMEVAYDLRAGDGHNIKDKFWFTINKPAHVKPQDLGFKNVDLGLLSAAKKEKHGPQPADQKASAERGKLLFQTMACAGCHSEGMKTDGMYGPPFQHLYNAERHFEDGSKTIADEKYLRESILNPSLKVVKGYSPEMPSFEGILSDSDIDSIILHIRSLSKK